jgi:hypothetical protein
MNRESLEVINQGKVCSSNTDAAKRAAHVVVPAIIAFRARTSGPA